LWMRSPPDIFKYVECQPMLLHQLAQVIGRHTWSELEDNRAFALTDQPQTTTDLGRIRAATLLILGEHDLPSTVECARLIRHAVAACEEAIVPGAGHLCLLEVPRIAARLIESHLLANRSRSDGRSTTLPEVRRGTDNCSRRICHRVPRWLGS
jgi:pimeloyl-ACP methyl ester carboxylesterase